MQQLKKPRRRFLRRAHGPPSPQNPNEARRRNAGVPSFSEREWGWSWRQARRLVAAGISCCTMSKQGFDKVNPNQLLNGGDEIAPECRWPQAPHQSPTKTVLPRGNQGRRRRQTSGVTRDGVSERRPVTRHTCSIVLLRLGIGAKPAVDLTAMMKSISLAMSAEKQASAACNRSLLSAVETSLPKPIVGLQRLDSPE
jgi:hypothetical protein